MGTLGIREWDIVMSMRRRRRRRGRKGLRKTGYRIWDEIHSTTTQTNAWGILPLLRFLGEALWHMLLGW